VIFGLSNDTTETIYFWSPLINRLQKWSEEQPSQYGHPDFHFSPDGALTAYGINVNYQYNGVIVARTESGEKILQINTSGFGTFVDDVSFSPDGQKILFSTSMGQCSETSYRAWDIQSNQQILVSAFSGFADYPIQNSDNSVGIQINPDGGILTDITTGKSFIILPPMDEGSFSADDTILFTQGCDGTVRLWGVPQS
jgi:WD40 repeat protein